MERHRLDLLSLLSGIVFLGLAVAFLTDSVRVTQLRGEWWLPTLALLAGLALLLSTRRPPEGLSPESRAAAETVGDDDAPTPRPATTFETAGESGDAATEVTPPIAGEGPAARSPSTWSPSAPSESSGSGEPARDEWAWGDTDETATVERSEPEDPRGAGEPQSTWEREERNAGS
jgi:hypothetical protein